MAKKPIVEAAEVVNDQVTIQAIDKALELFSPKKELEKIVEDYKGLKVKDTKDIEGMAKVKLAWQDLKEIRIKIDKTREAINKPYLEGQRKTNAVAKELTEIITPVEVELKTEMDRIEKALEIEKAAEEKRRNKLLQDAGFQMSGSYWICGPHQIPWTSIMEMTEEAINTAAEQGKAHLAEKAKLKADAEAAAKVEADRLAALKKEADEAIAKAAEAAAAREKEDKEFAEFKAMKAKAAASPAANAAFTPTASPTHTVTVVQKEAPQVVVSPERVDTASATSTASAPVHFPDAGQEVSQEFAFGFNTARSLIIKDFQTCTEKLDRAGWIARFNAINMPSSEFENLAGMVLKMFAKQQVYFATAKTDRDRAIKEILPDCKNFEAQVKKLAASMVLTDDTNSNG